MFFFCTNEKDLFQVLSNEKINLNRYYVLHNHHQSLEWGLCLGRIICKLLNFIRILRDMCMIMWIPMYYYCDLIAWMLVDIAGDIVC